VNRWIITAITLLSVFLLSGCQALPALTPTAAEVVDIKITLQPELTLSPEPDETEKSPSEIVTYPEPQAYPTIEDAAYPGAYPLIGVIDPYLAPGGSGYPTLEPYLFKTSQPSTATLKGTLIVIDPLTLMPAPDDAIYFVPLTEAQEGASTIPAIVKGETPQAEVDERTGDFVVTDIQPGQYAVVVITIGGSEIPVRFFDSNNLAIVTVTQADLDKTLDIGNLEL
jgi:hypothetical protein